MGTNASLNNSLQRFMRATHRVLGYLTLAMVIVYALSGITLVFRVGDFMRHDVAVVATLAPGLDADALASELRLKSKGEVVETDSCITFATGQYNKQTGEASYTVKEFIPPFDKFADLHMMPYAKNPTVGVFATLFGIALTLLAVTSLFMYKPSAPQFKRNMAYTALGVVLVIILVLLL